MERPSDDILFSEIPGQCAEEHPFMFTLGTERIYSRTQEKTIHVKYDIGDHDSEAEKKKELAQEFIAAMNQQGLIVYGFIRLVTLWYQHEYNTEQTPSLVADLERDYEVFFQEAQSLSR
jgi:hypothetical protein